MRKHTLALAVLSSLGLVACGGDSASTANNVASDAVSVEQPAEAPVVETPVVEETPVAEAPVVEESTPVAVEPELSAKVSFTANLRKSEAIAAYIGQTDWIDIELRRVPVGSYQELTELLDECDDNYVYDCGFWQDTVAYGQINNDTPTVDLSVLPGNYVIVANPYTENSDGWSINQGRIVAFAELTEGSHMLPLYAMQANWTLETPIDLMLLNQVNPFDEASTEAEDFDPSIDGEQTAAETLGLDPSLPLSAVHIASAEAFNQQTGSWPNIMDNESLELLNEVEWDRDVFASYTQGTDADSVFQMVDKLGNQYWEDIYDENTGEYLGNLNFETSISGAESVFSYANGETTQILDLGEVTTSTVIHSFEGGYHQESISAGLFFLSDIDLQDIEEESGVVDEYVDAMPNDYEPWHFYYDEIMVDDEGNEYLESNYINYILAWRNQELLTDIDGLVDALNTDAYSVTEFDDGSTISGTLVEWVSERSQGPDLKTTPDEILQPTDEEIKAATMFALMEEMMDGEEASAANARSEMCFDVSVNFTGTDWQNYGYVDGVWTAGQPNWSYWVEWDSSLGMPEQSLSVNVGSDISVVLDYSNTIEATEVISILGTDSVTGALATCWEDSFGECVSETEWMFDNIEDAESYANGSIILESDGVALDFTTSDITGTTAYLVDFDDALQANVVEAVTFEDDGDLIEDAGGWEGTSGWDIVDGYLVLEFGSESYKAHITTAMDNEQISIVDESGGILAESTAGITGNYTVEVTMSDDLTEVNLIDGHQDYAVSTFGGYAVYGDDLNGDGEVTPFETGIFWNPTCVWDDELQEEVCQDVDGDGVGERYESDNSISRAIENIELCLHPFTMTASDLDYPSADLGVVISEE